MRQTLRISSKSSLNSSATDAIQNLRKRSFISASTFSRSAGSLGRKEGGSVGRGGEGDRSLRVFFSAATSVSDSASSSLLEFESESDESESEEEEEEEDSAAGGLVDASGSTEAVLEIIFGFAGEEMGAASDSESELDELELEDSDTALLLRLRTRFRGAAVGGAMAV